MGFLFVCQVLQGVGCFLFCLHHRHVSGAADLDQMDDGERRAYLTESLFLNTVKYENDKLEAYMRKIVK